MRRGHFVMVYILLLVVLLTSALIDSLTYKNAVREKEGVDNALQIAADSAGESIAVSFASTFTKDFLLKAETEFFKSLTAGMSAYEDLDEQVSITFFVPALIVTVPEGFYVNTLQAENVNGERVLLRHWGECQPYTYSDEFYIYRFCLDDTLYIFNKSTKEFIDTSKKDVFANSGLLAKLRDGNVFESEETYGEYKRYAIAESIRDALRIAVNEHTELCGEYGVSYAFGVPSFMETFSPVQEYPSLLAVFQGYPLSGYNGKYVYNGASSSAAFITAVERYVVELPDSLHQPFSIMHKAECKEIGSYGKVLEDMVPLSDALKLYGAYACPDCFSEMEGVAVLP